MIAPAAVQEPALNIPPGPVPSLPQEPAPVIDDQVQPTPGPTLADAAVSGGPELSDDQDAPDAPPMTSEQIIGLVAELSAVGMPAKVASAYKDDLKANPLVTFGVEASGLADALAEYGLTAGGGKMPAWMSVLLGVSVLGYGVYSTRSKYEEHAPRAAEEGVADGFTGAGIGTPLSTTNIGFAHSGDQGGGAFVTS